MIVGLAAARAMRLCLIVGGLWKDRRLRLWAPRHSLGAGNQRRRSR